MNPVIFNTIEQISGWWWRSFENITATSTTPEQDAQLLGALSYHCGYLVNHKGKRYWYYFPKDQRDVSIITFLLERNGVVPDFRLSRYNCYVPELRPAFRLSASYVSKHKNVKKFVESINSKIVMPYSEQNTLIENMKQQMKTSQR